jgi:hypothetical protein
VVLLGETVALGAVRRAAGPASPEATRRRSMIAYGPFLPLAALHQVDCSRGLSGH